MDNNERNDADIIIELTDLWSKTEKEVVLDHITKLLESIGFDTVAAQRDYISKITGVSEHAVYAWFNRSREDVKIPLIKLCMIAKALNIDIKNIIKSK